MRSWPVDRKVKAVFAVLTAMAFGLAAITVVHTLTIERNFSRSQDVRRLLSYFDTVQALTPRSIAAGDHGTDTHQILWAAVDETLAQVASLESALSPSQRRALARFHNRLDYHRQAFMETVSDYRLDKHYAQEQLFAPVKLGLESGSSLQRVERTMAQLARFYVTRDLSVLEPIRAQLLQIKDRPLLDALSERVVAAESNYLSYLRILEREAFLSGALTEMLALGEELLAELELEARRIDRWLEFGMFALLLLYVLIVLVVSMGALRYVRHFLAAQTYAVAQIEKGNYDYEPLPCADDELGRLGQLIKRVAIGLGQSQSLTEKSLNRLRLASESTGLGIWELDLQADRLEWDERMYAIYGRDPRHPVRTYADWSAVVVPEDLISVENDFQRAVSPTGEFLSHFRIRRPDGATRHIEGHGSVVHDARGKPIAIIGSNLDVTERTRSEERLRLAARVFGSAREAILTTDQRGQIVDLNPAFSELTGWSREQMIGRNPLRLRSDRHPLAFYRTIVRAIKTHGYWRGEVWLARSDRVAFPGLVVISEVQDDAGQVTHYVGLIDDISSIKEQQRRLEHLARHDSLTQLPNRVLFADRLEQGMARARRSGSTLAVGYLDIDEFKAVNDRLGHKAGDRLLIEIARRIKAVLRTDDTLARLGGDEFALLLNDISGPGECHESLSRLMNELARPFALGEGSPVTVSASVGAVLYQGHSTSADELVRCADQAMYRAKELGRNRIELFHGPSTQKGVDRENTLTRIERALADGELQLYYQPRVDMRRGIVVGAEALIRWIHPTRGVIPPGEFLPVVEGTDFVGILGDWVIDSALTQLEAWRTAGLELSVSVNISPDHLQAQGFADRLAEHLVAHATVPPACLELEVLESPRLEDIGYIDSVIADCRASEVRFALDDFGTGFSSLAYLKGIPADVLKIDQSFVADLLTDRDDLALVAAIIGLAHHFDKQIVAEGVETIEHGAVLLRVGCSLAQGFGIARPMPADQFPEWMAGFSADCSWRDEPVGYWDVDRLPLVTADLQHRIWADQVQAYVIDGIERQPPPFALDPSRCRFGTWWDAVDRDACAPAAEVERITATHAEMHQLAGEAVSLKASGDIAAAHARLAQLRTVQKAFLSGLEAARSHNRRKPV